MYSVSCKRLTTQNTKKKQNWNTLGLGFNLWREDSFLRYFEGLRIDT